MTPQSREAEHLKILLDAGVPESDIDLVARYRIAKAAETALEDADRLREASRLLSKVLPASGTDVPEADRWGKGARITQTDLYGTFRTFAAAEAKARAAAADPDVNEIRSAAISGMARCVTEDDAQGLADRIEFAKRWEAKDQ